MLGYIESEPPRLKYLPSDKYKHSNKTRAVPSFFWEQPAAYEKVLSLSRASKEHSHK